MFFRCSKAIQNFGFTVKSQHLLEPLKIRKNHQNLQISLKFLQNLSFSKKVQTPGHLSAQCKAELTNPLATTHFKRFSKIQKNSKMRSAMQNFCIKNASYSQSSDKFLAAHADDSATQHARKSRKNQKILFPLRQVANITNLGQHQRYYYKEIHCKT